MTGAVVRPAGVTVPVVTASAAPVRTVEHSARDADGGTTDPTDPPVGPTDPPDDGEDGVPPEPHVSGNGIADADGQSRRLLGVNRSGGESRRVQGHGIRDGPVDDDALQAIADRDAGTVRVPLNEECRPGLSDVEAEYGGAHRLDAVRDLARVEAHGINPAPVAAEMPLVAGETGENTCAHSFTDQVMKWFDDRDLPCPGRPWNTWDRSSGPSLISDYDGTPASYGAGPRDRLRALNG
ncbi:MULTISPECIES: hypothetical protein [unclassified Streptomyces]|uniref:hypothetical protein n=1 Tax=unclassified Streptomyces TaxID=2593676 RepID=UPI0004BF2179|nr:MULTISPECIES: hypothetical protein [unclassified Streptomyces]